VIARSVTAAALLALAAVAPGQTAVQPASQTAAATTAGSKSPRTASYSIDARLDPATRTLTGSQLLTWRNSSSNATSTLQFHLYYNAWRNSSSTWMRESRLAGRTTLDARPEGDWGWIDVERVHLSRGSAESEVTPALRFVAPDDGNTEDRTVLELPLDTPVLPGETISVRMAWSSRIPRTFARTGVIGNYYFVAQWFPKIGVLQDHGWNCHQFHATTEFFADFGAYDVRLNVPRGWIVGATGVERERHEQPDGTTTHRYAQEDVHDFAWTTSPDYLEITDDFTHATLPAVRMRLLLQPEHRGQERRHFDATRAALKFYGEWYGPYPYGHVTIVDPAWQSGAGGMEYPTLFTAGTRWLAPRLATQPESVTIHEAGHQFWYGIVASNEFEHAWLDEGLNTFSTSRALAQTFEPNYVVRRYFGGFVPWVFRDLPIRREAGSRSLVAYRAAARADAQALPSWRYWPGTAGGTTYHKTSLWLHTLERMLGWETLQRILSTYFDRWAFRHPTPADFFAIANEVSGQDLTWFFDQVHRSGSVFDYGIEVFRSEPAAVRGYTGDQSARTFQEDARSGDLYRTTIVARRHGEATFPVDVRVVFDNNEEMRWRWDGRDRWKLFEIDKPVRARRVDVDPERILLLDINVTNNSALLEPAAARAARKWSLAWLIWLQDHLLTYGFFV
jgi:hypothetical protein